MGQLHTHGSTQEKSRDFANKSMYAKLTTRLTRYHETVWGETCVNVAGKLSWFSAQQAPGLQFWPTLGWQGCQRPCKMESKMAHWRSPRTILLMKIFFIFSYSLFFSIFDRNVEIVFSEFKKQNNFDELKSRKVLWKIFRICRLHYFWTKFNDKEEEDQFTKNVCARSGRLLRVSGKLQAIARKTANRCTSWACLLDSLLVT